MRAVAPCALRRVTISMCVPSGSAPKGARVTPAGSGAAAKTALPAARATIARQIGNDLTHPGARIVEKLHPGGVLGPILGRPAHAGGAENPLRVGHDDRDAARGCG